MYCSIRPDITCIVETWLSEDVMDNELSLPDYQVYRLDRNGHGTVVALLSIHIILCHVGYCCKVAHIRLFSFGKLFCDLLLLLTVWNIISSLQDIPKH